MKLFTFSFLLFSFSLCASHIGTFPVKKYNLSTENNTLGQDSYGNILRGSTSGLSLLKGGRWENMKVGETSISYIEASVDGKVFLGNDTWFGVLRGDSIEELSSGLFEQAGFTKLNKIISASTGNYAHIDRTILNLDGDIVDYDYNDIVFAGRLNKNLIIQRDRVGLFLFAGNKFRKINGSEAYANLPLLEIVELKEGKFLFVFQNEGVIYDGDNFLPWTEANGNWLSKIEVDKACSNQEGVFLSNSSELYHLDFNGELIRLSNMNRGIDNLFVDKDQNLWVSAGRELILFQCSLPFRKLNGLNASGTDLKKVDDLIFIGTERGAYLTDEFSFLNGGLPRQISEGYINNIEEGEGQCFISSELGLSIYSRGRLESISKDIGSQELLVLDSETHMIEACASGLNLYEKQYGRWVFLNHLYGVEESTSHLIKDERNRLWVLGIDKGVSMLNYDPVLMTVNPTTFELSSEKGELVNGVFLINGKPVVTAKGSIYEFNETLGRFEKSRIYNSLFGEYSDVKCLYQDEYENIWYVSENESGVLKVIDRGLEKITEKIEIPELNGRINSISPFVYSLGNSKVVLGGKEGFLYVNTSKLKTKEVFVAELYKISSYNKKQELEHVTWNRDLRTSKLLRFAKSVKSLELRFSSTYSNLDSTVMFSYNINDQGWSEKGRQAILNVNLQRGKNNVKVRAHYGFNELSNTLVVPILLEQAWFMEELNQYLILAGILLVIALFAIIAWLLVRNRNKRIVKLEEEFKLTKTELKELREKNEVLGGQLISAINENNIGFQLEKLAKGSDDPEIQKAVKKLAKKLKSLPAKESTVISTDPDFIARLKVKYPALTKKDIKLCSLLKMDLTTKDIAPILEITVRGVEISRYRLRKKLDLGNEVVLADFLKEL